MNKVYFLLLTIIFTVSVIFGETKTGNIRKADKVRGCTHNPGPGQGATSIGIAPDYKPKQKRGRSYKSAVSNRGWSLVESLDFDLYAEAATHFAVYFDESTNSLQSIAPQYHYALTSAASAAIDKAPQWLRNDLTWVFSNITEAYQDLWAGGINDAEDPYIDEVAFCVAHSSPQYLMSDYGSPQLFLDNAQLIYENDSHLDYVEVVDYATTEDDYFSTTVYYTERDSVVSQVEVPKEIYYWYIVHPKITDEIPAYIDPAHTEDNSSHNDNIAEPPAGKFWRDYLFNHADAGYYVLRDSLAGCPIVWDGTQTINSDNNSAIEIINRWINATLVFDSDDERPHQPVRIYAKHKGRCGEYADFTAAAARAALIPCTSIFSYSSDHTWNEFWDMDWVQWEPVNNYVDKPLVYENGWGKIFGTVFEIRSDGFLTPVTDRYSEGLATINIYVMDSNGDPVDGAGVWLYARDLDYPFYWNDYYSLTDKDGKCSIVVGEDRDYAVRVTSAIGDYPVESNQVLQITSSAVNGETYNSSLTVSGTMPSLNRTAVDTPSAAGGTYRMVINFDAPKQILMGDIWMDDVASDSKMCKDADSGRIDFFMTDETNYNAYNAGTSFDAFNLLQDAYHGEPDFYIPSTGNWYCVFSNDRNLNNPQHITGSVELYSNIASDIADKRKQSAAQGYALMTNYPNPFNPTTLISWQLAVESDVELAVYDLLGNKIKKLVNEKQAAGTHSIQFNGSGLASGVYLYKIMAWNLSSDAGQRFIQMRKMLLLK